MAAHTNRLAHEKSPYLLQHAHNPVDWFPWGEEAFAKARKENKPIFLSIGYSTCHWCHVMERESFENADVAELMNRCFVSIKVDREERPDIDKIYMTAVQATTGSGGWPMSVWLTPDLKPFYCGTYFPPESRYGRPGFKELLQRVHDVWESNPDGVVAQAKQVMDVLTEHSALPAAGDTRLDDAPLKLGLDQFRLVYDSKYGGFGGAPKFPRPVVLNFLFRVGGKDMALFTLRKMGEGGMFDQLGGGFHRYSVDERWLVSHFEKMLYDQAQLVCSCVDAYQITHDPFFADIARRTCDYVLRDMTAPDGGFYSAEDADSEGVEGKFYVWTRKEIEQVLGDKAESFCRAYDVDTPGNWEHGLNVLHGAGFPEERTKLFAAREKRVRPHRDEKILTAWNGLMISAFARASQALDEPKYRAAALNAAHLILTSRIKDGKLMRTETVPGMVEDYAFFANGLVDLYETDFDPQWLLKAIELSDTMLKLFYDPKDGGFFQTDGRDASVLVRSKEDYDGAEPSGNSMATLLLLRLAQFTDRDDYRKAAERTLTAFSPLMQRAPHVVPQMLCALDLYLSKPKQIIIAGKSDDTMLRVIREKFLPNKIVAHADQRLVKLMPYIKDMTPVDGKATAYVCEDFVCQLPTNDIEALRKLLER
ncbi:MAG TPA: thioredoxin domain-containing protein [Verrucomicrobiae bacterium]|nr:thioredoxin domain-containing protein [Verrucomicrobiae bacterium]